MVLAPLSHSTLDIFQGEAGGVFFADVETGLRPERLIGYQLLWASALLCSQLLEEIEDFCGWHQEKVAKIVQCGEHLSYTLKRGHHDRWPLLFRI